MAKVRQPFCALQPPASQTMQQTSSLTGNVSLRGPASTGSIRDAKKNNNNRIGRRMSIQLKKALSFRSVGISFCLLSFSFFVNLFSIIQDENLLVKCLEEEKEEEPETIYKKPIAEIIERSGGPIPPIVKQITRQLRNRK